MPLGISALASEIKLRVRIAGLLLVHSSVLTYTGLIRLFRLVQQKRNSDDGRGATFCLFTENLSWRSVYSSQS